MFRHLDAIFMELLQKKCTSQPANICFVRSYKHTRYIVRIHKIVKKYEIDSTDSLQYSDVLYYTDHKPPQLSVLSCFHIYGWCIQMPVLIPYDLE